MKILIITSLFPQNIPHQQNNVDTWKRLGFHVCSINGKAEIDVLRDSFPSINFIQVNRTGEEKYGKPLVFFDDIIKFIRSNKEITIAGIVNADISFIGSPLYKTIAREAVGSFVFGSRVDINSREESTGTFYDHGFDYFFFDVRIADCYPREEFCLGVPWWDYWAPFVPLLKGIPVKKLMNPCAYHVKHDVQYRVEDWRTLGRVIGKYVPVLFSSVREDIGQLEIILRKIINDKSRKIYFSHDYHDDIQQDIHLLTSIAPREIEKQIQAMQSWRKDSVAISVINARDEQELIGLNRNISFVSPDRDARIKYGKPFVYFDDMLDFFRKDTRSEICGIINSDIYLTRQDELYELVRREVKEAFIFGSRIDVETLESKNNGKMYDYGFDYFFFDRKLLELFPREDFCFGLPWWDFWIVMTMIAKKIEVKRIMTPVAFHVIHPLNWQQKPWNDFGVIMAKYFKPNFSITSRQAMQRYLHLVAHTIHKKAKPITLST